MRYVPKELKGNVNVSPESALKELASLLISILGILLIIYIALGFIVDLVAPRLPENIEQGLGIFYKSMYIKSGRMSAAEKKVGTLLNTLSQQLLPPKKYQVYIVKSNQVNALALAGGNIVMFSGLLEEINSENELAFVLAHEMGHFAHRDHLRALGRGLVFFALSSLFLGQENSVSKFLGNSLTKVEMKFSQSQEKKADLFALKILQKKYGHVGGAIEFLEKIGKKRKIPKFLYFFATHPHPENRIRAVREKIKRESYLIKKVIPLEGSIKEIFKPKQKTKN